MPINNDGIMIILSSPSGAGKTTLVSLLSKLELDLGKDIRNRSQDYNSLLWVIQQLFEDVQAVKPNSSRAQSAEIFLVCMKYTAPNHIDPKLLGLYRCISFQ